MSLLLAGLSMGATAIGTGLSMYSNHLQNEATKKQLRERRKLAKKNFSFQKEVAGQNYEAGLEKIDQYEIQGNSFLSTQKAGAGASGVGTGGSQALVARTSENNLRSDIDTMKDNNLTAYQNHLEQAQLDYEANNPSYTGGAGYAVQQFGTLLTGASQMASQALSSNLVSPYGGKSKVGQPGKALSHQSYYGW